MNFRSSKAIERSRVSCCGTVLRRDHGVADLQKRRGSRTNAILFWRSSVPGDRGHLVPPDTTGGIVFIQAFGSAPTTGLERVECRNWVEHSVPAPGGEKQWQDEVERIKKEETGARRKLVWSGKKPRLFPVNHRLRFARIRATHRSDEANMGKLASTAGKSITFDRFLWVGATGWQTCNPFSGKTTVTNRTTGRTGPV